jgi:hypothetical protein
MLRSARVNCAGFAASHHGRQLNRLAPQGNPPFGFKLGLPSEAANLLRLSHCNKTYLPNRGLGKQPHKKHIILREIAIYHERQSAPSIMTNVTFVFPACFGQSFFNLGSFGAHSLRHV